MNICMMAYTFYENDNRVMRYAEALSKRGDTVDVIALRKPGQKVIDSYRGVTVFRIQKRRYNERRNKLAYLFRLLSFFVISSIFISFKYLKCKYKVIHVHSVPDFEVFAAALPRVFGAKLILDIHDIVPEFYCSKFNVNKSSSIFKALVLIEKISTLFVHHVIVSNHIWQKRLIGRSVDENKCTVIMNYPDPSLFSPRPLNNHGDKIILLYPGTISYHQGLDIGLEAVSLLIEKYPFLEFHVYGDGPDRERLEKLIIEKHVENNFYIFDIVPIDEVADIMAKADIGVVPKRGDTFSGEAFSTKSLEFMSLGIPMIMSSTPIDRFYFDDDTVQFFEVGDAYDLANKIELLIMNKERREQLSLNGKKVAKRYSWDVRQKEYFHIIDMLLR